jgi:hypothetical protein
MLIPATMQLGEDSSAPKFRLQMEMQLMRRILLMLLITGSLLAFAQRSLALKPPWVVSVKPGECNALFELRNP